MRSNTFWIYFNFQTKLSISFFRCVKRLITHILYVQSIHTKLSVKFTLIDKLNLDVNEKKNPIRFYLKVQKRAVCVCVLRLAFQLWAPATFMQIYSMVQKKFKAFENSSNIDFCDAFRKVFQFSDFSDGIHIGCGRLQIWKKTPPHTILLNGIRKIAKCKLACVWLYPLNTACVALLLIFKSGDCIKRNYTQDNFRFYTHTKARFTEVCVEQLEQNCHLVWNMIA